VGSEAAKALLEGLGRVHPSPGAREAWLDFGCGCGRVTRHLLASDRLGTLCGVDVDSSHIRWLRRHVRAEWHPILPKPPTPLGSERFDVVACVSVFTHFDETRQDEWLSELVRLLRPGGFLLATTHGPDLGKVCPGITPEDVERLASFGFLFRALPGGAFSDQAAFHSEQYMTQHWDQRLRLVAWRPKALLGYQDLGIWRRMT
jgi:SAM-dependent methyltransferase